MALRQSHRKIERIPEQVAELRAVREQFQRDRPTLEDLVDTGEYDGPFRHGDIMDLLALLAGLRRERERLGLSLADVSTASGIDKGMLSRLESGKLLNPTLSTLWRYSQALGMTCRLSAEPISA